MSFGDGAGAKNFSSSISTWVAFSVPISRDMISLGKHEFGEGIDTNVRRCVGSKRVKIYEYLSAALEMTDLTVLRSSSRHRTSTFLYAMEGMVMVMGDGDGDGNVDSYTFHEDELNIAPTGPQPYHYPFRALRPAR